MTVWVTSQESQDSTADWWLSLGEGLRPTVELFGKSFFCRTPVGPEHCALHLLNSHQVVLPCARCLKHTVALSSQSGLICLRSDCVRAGRVLMGDCGVSAWETNTMKMLALSFSLGSHRGQRLGLLNLTPGA